MVWVGNVVLLAALSWLPSALIFGALWFLGSRIDAAPSRPWLPATAGLAGGFCLGLLILGPLAQHPLLIALVIVGVVIALLLAATRVAYRALVAGGAAVVVGAHVAVFARAVGSETQDVFWAMPILDLWVILGVPLVLAAAPRDMSLFRLPLIPPPNSLCFHAHQAGHVECRGLHAHQAGHVERRGLR